MLAKITVADYMSTRLIKLTEDMTGIDAIKKILDHKITGAPVFDEHDKVIGMFSEKDALKMVLEVAYNQSSAGKVTEYMTKEVIKLEAEMSIVDLADKFQNSLFRSFPVYRDHDLVGIISRTDVLRALATTA
ncbi:MAG TPA: CBS domain-containing protein [Methyloprofundus sp.]|uniref:CBS domain-containing protein n=1 Tax=Methyloprofundus sp. TaxID=2020875 RepID=UPI0017EAE35A|nr:CBS domain-containing protein [Methyloprofundus sp.]HIG65733.1 CBS domain-containing protein [Methyloprofundus sp.]HIL77837.1 CBS domain-containing protein [Methylococcales bacterium]